MLDMTLLEKMGKEAGFTHVGLLDVDTIELMPEVRDMCRADSCGRYGKNWCCPPGVGDLDACREKLKKYKWGILVQTVGELEDEWDGEGMMEAQENQKEALDAMTPKLKELYPQMTIAGTGCCTKCKTCTYPDAPCRFPDYSYASMEAYGMLVSDICAKNNMAYYYGKGTIAYTACFFLE